MTKKIWYLLIALLFMLSGCKQSSQPSVSNTETVHTATHFFAGNFEECISSYLNKVDELESESRDLMNKSTEGGELVRYQDRDGETVRYKMLIYGEMGRLETNYYIIGDRIYYSELWEKYSRPIYWEPGSIDIWNRELEQGMLVDGQYYQYDSSREQFELFDAVELPYRSLAELDEEFDGLEVTGADDFSEYNIIAVNGYLLGGCYDNQWFDCFDLYPLIEEKENYKIYVNGEYQRTESGQKEAASDWEIYAGPRIHYAEQQYYNNQEDTFIAYSGIYDLEIEDGRAISPDNDIYKNESNDYLTETGLSEDYKLTNIIKIDLDGDGQDEVLIQAYYFDELYQQSKGIHYMRKVVNGQVENYNIPLTEPTDEWDYITIRGFCDLNGDGIKEVLLSARGIGYHCYLAYEFKENQFIRIFENGACH